MRLIRPTHITHALATSALLSLAALGCGGDGPLAPGLGSGRMTGPAAPADTSGAPHDSSTMVPTVNKPERWRHSFTPD